MASERAAIVAFFRDADRDDFVALPPSAERYDQDEGHDEARAVAQQRGISHPSWMFWHRQAAWVFDSEGNLTSGLRINWGGDHAKVAAVLAGLPYPLRAESTGPGGVFVITSDALAARALEPFPDFTDTQAVKDRIRRITDPVDHRTPESWSEAEKLWMAGVLQHGDVLAQGAVVAWIIRWDELPADALDALLTNWVKIYAKASSWANIRGLLDLLSARSDPRLDAVIAECERRKTYSLRSGLAYFLAERAAAEDIPRLYRLAQTPGAYEHTPGNAPALKGWVAARATHEGRTQAEIAAEALQDQGFDAAAQRALAKIAERGK